MNKNTNLNEKSKEELIDDLNKVTFQYNSLKESFDLIRTTQLINEKRSQDILDNMQDTFFQADLSDSFSSVNPNEKAEIKDSSQMWKTIFQDIPNVAIQGYDKDGITKYWNKASEVLYGYTSEEAIGVPLTDLIIPEELKSSVNDAIKAMFTSKIPIPTGELKLKRKDGSSIFVLSSHSFVQVPGQEPVMYCIDVDISKRKQTELALESAKEKAEDNEEKYKILVETASDAIYLMSDDGYIIDTNQAACVMLGKSKDEIIGSSIDSIDTNYTLGEFLKFWGSIPFNKQHIFETTHLRKDGTFVPVEINAKKYKNYENVFYYGIARDITERKQMQALIEKRMIALTRPLGQAENITFDELFDLVEIQRIQDEFSAATGVASIITLPDGTPITEPSNFTFLCNEIIRKTKKGCSNCFKSDAALGRYHPEGPVIQPCMSGGLWDAGASITIGNRHIANWLIGQVRDETQTDEAMRMYAKEIGADEEHFMTAFYKVPVMSQERFEKTAQALFTLSNQLSTSAYQNIQQARLITEEKEIKTALLKSEENLSITLNSIGDGVISTDINGLIVNMNPVAEQLCGWQLKEALGKPLPEVFKIINAETRQTVADPVTKVLENGEKVGLANHTVLISKDGKEYQIADSSAPIKNKEDKISGVVLVFSDVTEKYAAEKKIKESEECFRSIIESSPIGKYIYQLQEDGRLIFMGANPSADRIIGIDHHSLVGKTIQQAFPKLALTEIPEMYARIARGELPTQSFEIDYSENQVNGVFQVTVFRIGNNSIAVDFMDITERKQSEKALEESELTFRKLFEESSDAILLIDETGVFVECNQAALDLLKMTREQFLFRSPGSISPEFQPNGHTSKESAIELIDLAYKKGLHRFDWTHVNAEGGEFIVDISLMPIVVKGKTMLHTTWRDITERKLAEDTLRQSQEMMRSSQSVAHICSYSTNLNENELATSEWVCSPEFYKIFGIDDTYPHTIAGWAGFIHPDHRQELLAYHESVVKEKKSFNREYKIIRINDGAERWVQGTGEIEFDGKGKPIRMYGAIQDITERKQSEIELLAAKEKAEESEAKVKLLNHLTSEMLLLRDLESIYKYVVDNLIKYHPNTIILYVSVDESSKQTRLEAIAGLDNILLMKVIKISGFNPIGKHYKITDLHNDYFRSGNLIEFNGGLSEFSASEFPAISANAIEKLVGLHKIYTIGINKDNELLAAIHFFTFNKQIITDSSFIEVFVKQAGLVLQKKMNEKSLIIAKDRAEESDRLKTAFLMNISHEIRTPMNGIIGFLNLLKDPDLSDDEKSDYISIVSKSGERLMNTINDIVDISRIEIDDVELNYHEVNVCELMQYYFDFFKIQTEETGIDFINSNKMFDEAAIIKSDKHKLDGILMNLIRNAIKFTSVGRIEIGNYIEGDNLYFYVSDTGKGIPQDRIEAIFNRFEQAELGTTRGHEGLGIGLSLVKAYVEALNGKIEVTSEVGIGSTFQFCIPYFPVSGISSDREDNQNQSDTTSLNTILIAEDDELKSIFLKKILSKKYKLVLASSGEEALHLFENTPEISLILMDVKMPGKYDGLEAARKIRERNQKIPIIVQTAYAKVFNRFDSLEAGCNDYIAKPFSGKELLTLLQKYSN